MAVGDTLAWRSAWHDTRQKLFPKSAPGCIHLCHPWRRLRPRAPAVLFEGVRYCIGQCLETALTGALRRTVPPSAREISHRIPLGLLLLSRRDVSAEQLRAGLEAQRAHGSGKIGEWLESLGFINENQVTAALARQWGCPISKVNSFVHRAFPGPQIPLALLEKSKMIPVEFVPSSATLLVAFANGIEYQSLLAIEQMLGCRTEPCMAVSSFVSTGLRELSSEQDDAEFVFDKINDASEFCRIVRSYCLRLLPSEIRLVNCGPYIWVRLFRTAAKPVDLLMCLPVQRAFVSSH